MVGIQDNSVMDMWRCGSLNLVLLLVYLDGLLKQMQEVAGERGGYLHGRGGATSRYL